MIGNIDIRSFGVDITGSVDATAKIQAAINSLPPSGGTIFFPAGTYKITDTLTVPDSSIEFVGTGEGTVFDSGNNGLTFFTIPNLVLTESRQYIFSKFKIKSNSRSGSEIISIQDSNAFGRVLMKELRSEGIQTMVDIVSIDSNFLVPVQVDIYDSWFLISGTYFNFVGDPVCANCAVLCQTNRNGGLMRLTCHNVNFMGDEFSTVGGSITGDAFGGLDASFYDCQIAMASEDGLNSIHAERCRIWDFNQPSPGFPHTIFLGGLGFSPDDDPRSAFIGCNLLGLFIDDSGGLFCSGGIYTNSRISASVSNGHCQVTGVTFRGDSGSAAIFPAFVGVLPNFIGGSELSVTGCRFTSTIAVEEYIDASDSMYIFHCSFANLNAGAGVVAGIRVTSSNNAIIGCDFDSLWGVPPIKEVYLGGAAKPEGNIYSGNIGLKGNGGTTSVFLAPNPSTGAGYTGNTFNGSALFTRTGNTTDALVVISAGSLGLGTSDDGIRANPSGLIGYGTIKNTGANSMDVKETVTDLYGVTDNQTNTVVAGADRLLTVGVNIGTARPPYISYKVEVKSTGAGNATSFDYKQALNSETTW